MQLEYFSQAEDELSSPHRLDGPHTLVLAFGHRSLLEQPAPLHDLTEMFPTSVVMGCSSAGQMVSNGVVDTPLSVTVARFERTKLRRVSAPVSSPAASFSAGEHLVAQLPSSGLRAVLVLCCGVNVNGAALVQGMRAGLADTVAISGGLAADGNRFQKTWVIEGGGPREHIVTAVGFYGDALRMGYGCSGGWTEFGPERTVTGSEGNVLRELDGQPALALYKHYLGDFAQQLPGSALLFPLALRERREGTGVVVRTILAIDDDAQTMTFAGDIPRGSTVRLMRTNVDNLIDSAAHAARQAVESMALQATQPAPPVLALSVSCIGRRLVMGERTDDEVEAVIEQLPDSTSHTGFYSYGEISPAQGSMTAELHNQTMTVTLFSEAE